MLLCLAEGVLQAATLVPSTFVCPYEVFLDLWRAYARADEPPAGLMNLGNRHVLPHHTCEATLVDLNHHLPLLFLFPLSYAYPMRRPCPEGLTVARDRFNRDCFPCLVCLQLINSLCLYSCAQLLRKCGAAVPFGGGANGGVSLCQATQRAGLPSPGRPVLPAVRA